MVTQEQVINGFKLGIPGLHQYLIADYLANCY